MEVGDGDVGSESEDESEGLGEGKRNRDRIRASHGYRGGLKRRSANTPVGRYDTTSRGQQEHDLPGRCSNTRSAERRYQVVRAIRPRRSPIGVRWATRLIGSRPLSLEADPPR